jgi:ABC-type arginine/histidine transport system permease subunit
MSNNLYIQQCKVKGFVLFKNHTLIPIDNIGAISIIGNKVVLQLKHAGIAAGQELLSSISCDVISKSYDPIAVFNRLINELAEAVNND